MFKIIILSICFILITITESKNCLDVYNCFNSEKQCQKQTQECMNDPSCLQILSSPDSCLFNCTKDCLKNPRMEFPSACFSSCIPEKHNQKYSNLMNCKLSACDTRITQKFSNLEFLASNDDCTNIRGVWKGTITYPVFTDHWISGCTGETTMTITGSDNKFFYTLDVKCPGTIGGNPGPYCNSYCNEGTVQKIGSCKEGAVSIKYFSGMRIGDMMVLISEEGTQNEARITLSK